MRRRTDPGSASKAREINRRLRELRRGSPPQQRLPSPRSNLLKTLSDHPIFSILGAVSSAIAIWAAIYTAFQSPEISVETANPTKPFDSHFLITNKSFLPLRDAQFDCYVDNFLTSQEQFIQRIHFVDATTANIDGNSSASYHCLADHTAVTLSGTVKVAHVFGQLRYKTLGLQRLSKRVEFTWYTDGDPHRWIQGKVVD